MQWSCVNTYTFAVPHVPNSFPSLFVLTAAIGTGQGGRTGVEQQPPLEKTGEDEVQPRHGTDSIEPRPPTHRLRPSLGTIQRLGYVFRLPASNRRRLSHDIYQENTIQQRAIYLFSMRILHACTKRGHKLRGADGCGWSFKRVRPEDEPERQKRCTAVFLLPPRPDTSLPFFLFLFFLNEKMGHNAPLLAPIRERTRMSEFVVNERTKQSVFSPPGLHPKPSCPRIKCKGLR